MAVKIKLKRMGKIRAPYYRVVVADSRTKRDGRAIEEIGKYHPTEDPSLIDIDSDRAQHWLKCGAQPTEAVLALFKVTGDWQKFKGLPGAEGTLRVAVPKESKAPVFVAAGNDATTRRGSATAPKAARAEEAPAAEAPAAEAPAAEVPAPEAPAAEATAPDATPSDTTPSDTTPSDTTPSDTTPSDTTGA